MDSPPSDMAPFYKGGYDPIPKTVAELKAIAGTENYRSAPILRHKIGGRFLEIGPWRGVLCCSMKDAGFAVSAIEMDPNCVEFLNKKLGIEAIQSVNPAESMKELEPGFDAIAAWHSMEHLPRPWDVIGEASRLLAPGGILLLAMPNPDSYEFRKLREAWVHLDAPRHLYLISMKLLEQICQKNGLRLLESTTSDEFSEIQSKFAWLSWARTWVPIRFVRGLLGIVGGGIMYRLARRQQMKAGQGSGYTAVFVKN